MKKSVFQKVVIIIDGLAGPANDQFLKYLLESGDISGLTVILFNSWLHLDCDLELNEDPSNALQKIVSRQMAPHGQNRLSKAESEMLKLFTIIDAPVPNAVAQELAGPRSTLPIKILLKKDYLQEKNQCLCFA